MEIFKRSRSGAPTQNDTNTLTTPKPIVSKPINDADCKQFGFVNFGNTCYANSILQALYFCKPFRQFVCEFNDGSVPLPLPIPVPPTSAPPASPLPKPPGLNPFPFRRRDSTISAGRADDSNAPPSKNIVSTPAQPAQTIPPTLFSALRSLFLHIALNPTEKGTVSPTSFIDKVKEENPAYRSAMHQDAHEFLGFLLNRVAENVKEVVKRNPPPLETNGNGNGGSELSSSVGSLPGPASVTNSSGSRQQRRAGETFIQDLFEGTLTSETRCLTCENVSSRDESFLDLSIDIEQNSSITACLRQFSASEMLAHKNKFFCDACGSLQEAEKRMKIKKLPNVLALHLKRFKYQEDRYVKLSYRVAFPFELRLFNTVDDAPDPDRLYQLFAIVVHIGVGAHHGHYITIIKSRNIWYTFDDETVQVTKEGDIAKYFGGLSGESGYVLFYQAADLDAETTPSDAASPLQDGPIAADVQAASAVFNNPPTSPIEPEASVPLARPLEPSNTGSIPVNLKLTIPSQPSSGDPRNASSEEPRALAESNVVTPTATTSKTPFGTLRSPSFKREKRPKSSGLESTRTVPNGDVPIPSPHRSRSSFFSPSKKKSEKNLTAPSSPVPSSVPTVPPLPTPVVADASATFNGATLSMPNHVREPTATVDLHHAETNGVKEGSSSSASASVSASTSSVSISIPNHNTTLDTSQQPPIPPPTKSNDQPPTFTSPFIPSTEAPLKLPPPPSSPNPRRRTSLRPVTSPSAFTPPDIVKTPTPSGSLPIPTPITAHSRARTHSAATLDQLPHSATTSLQSSSPFTSSSLSAAHSTPPSSIPVVPATSAPPPIPERSSLRNATDKPKLKTRRPSLLQTLLGRGQKD